MVQLQAMNRPAMGFGLVRRRREVLVLLPLAFAAILLGACSSPDEASAPSEEQRTSAIPVVEVQARWASAYAAALPTLMDWAPWAFVGEVVRLEEQREIDLVPENGYGSPEPTVPGKATPGSAGPPPFPVSYFEVRVVKALAGGLSAGDSVSVRQFGGIQKQNNGSTVRVQMERDEPLEPGRTYLFFVQPSEGGVFQTSPFARMAEEEDGTFAPLPGWAGLGALEAIAAMSAGEAADAIAAAGASR
jgi:hypothetical protein